MRGWDSEGADIGGEHKTIMLANYDELGRGDMIVDVNGLSTERLLSFMLARLDRSERSVAFAFDYDVNMILGDLTQNHVERLWNREPLRWKGVKLEYIPRKSFSLWDATKRGGTIWDVFGFCQQSFVKALKAYGIAADIAKIEAMKNERPTFQPENVDTIAEYCRMECVALAQLALKIERYFYDAHLHLQRFDGAGAAGAALLRREGVKRHLVDLPPRVENVSRYAYYGGRIECLKYGTTRERVYEYDINSAYPAAALELPSLVNATWTRANCPALDSRFAIYRVRWNLRQQRLYPFPWRSHTGAIYYPSTGEGWYWRPEVDAALKYAKGKIEIVDGWQLSDTGERPFAFLTDVYEQRREWKAAGIGAEKALKLAINSVYGKLAQQRGAKGVAPAYHCLPWAGWITSATRARLYSTAMLSPDTTLMLATDAVYSLIPLPLKESKALGDWSSEVHEGATIVQSGVYWVGDNPVKSRGFDADSLSREAVHAAWRRGETSYPARHTHFVGMGRALQQSFDKWRKWLTEDRVLSLYPAGTKRCDIPGRRQRPHLELCDTWAVNPFTGRDIMSAPIVRPWDEENEAVLSDEGLCWKI